MLNKKGERLIERDGMKERPRMQLNFDGYVLAWQQISYVLIYICTCVFTINYHVLYNLFMFLCLYVLETLNTHADSNDILAHS